jgi:hypothetical protein
METGRMDLHQNLVVLGHRLVDVPELQDIEIAIPVLDDGFHALGLGQVWVAWAGVLGPGYVLGHEVSS